MANQNPISLFPRHNSKTDAVENSSERVIEHQHAPEGAEPDLDTTLGEGGDAGTKGTGSAG